ncbi:unnamed protein product [Adineta ricciae]|uniref:SnoaL-like domain-containing protein n=1 Tax=Adineta ricciae TaxID=249248 RepID=A0A813UG31_ADIRI|nr:unnamed protein product [Adineta ricciae]CAF1352257.1 unnamed protein product [Adineta ricciae]
MVVSTVLNPEQIEASQAWVYRFYRLFDSLEVDQWIEEFYNPDSVVHFGNFPPMEGAEVLRAHFKRQNAQLLSMRHDLKHIDVFPDRIYVQNEATFVVKNDPERKEIKFPAVCLFWKNINEKKSSTIDVYLDPSPLLERLHMFSSQDRVE